VAPPLWALVGVGRSRALGPGVIDRPQVEIFHGLACRSDQAYGGNVVLARVYVDACQLGDPLGLSQVQECGLDVPGEHLGVVGAVG
jgi:hypothetical protein